MDKFIVAPPNGSTNNSIGAADGKWQEGHFEKLPNWQEYLAESTGYGIVSGCTPSISGLTVTVAAGVVHLAGGTRNEMSATNITLDNADPTNPRIDLVYIDSTGAVAKVTGTAAASPSAPSVPSNGIKVCVVTVAANASTGTVVVSRDMLARWQNTGIVNVKDFGAVGDGVTDDTAAFENALLAARGSSLIVPMGSYKITDNIFSDDVISVQDLGTYPSIKPAYSASVPYIKGNSNMIRRKAGLAVPWAQGMTYDTSRNKLLVADSANSDANQAIYVVNPITYEVEQTYNYTDMGHMNSLAYCPENDKVYATDFSTQNLYVVKASDMTYESTFQLSHVVDFLDYDRICKVFVTGYLDTSDWIYHFYIYDPSFNLLKTFAVSRGNPTGGNRNDILAHNGHIIQICGQEILEVDYFGNILSDIITHFNREWEGIAIDNNSKIFLTAGENFQISVYTCQKNINDSQNNPIPQFEYVDYDFKDTVDLNYLRYPGVYFVHATTQAESISRHFPQHDISGWITLNFNVNVICNITKTGALEAIRQIATRYYNSSEIWTRVFAYIGSSWQWTSWTRLDAAAAMPGGAYSDVSGYTVDTEETFTAPADGWLSIWAKDTYGVEAAGSYLFEGWRDSQIHTTIRASVPVKKGATVAFRVYGGTIMFVRFIYNH